MFNEEQKIAFIKDTAKSAAYQRNIALPLKLAEPFEQKWGDISSWSKDQFEEFFKSRNYTSVSTMKSEVLTVRRYCAWCLEKGVIANCSAINDIDTTEFVATDGAGAKMVESPSALANYLKDIFKQETVENSAFKFYYWCAFMGFFEEEVLHIGCDNVDFDNMVIRYGDEEYQIFDESADVIKTLCEQNDGSVALLQTFDTDITPNSLSRKMSGKIKGGVKRLAFRNVRKSGVFYQTYRQELQGIPVRFDTEISRQLLRHEYSGWGDSALKQKTELHRKATLRNVLTQEYDAWKATFNLGILENARKHILAAKVALLDALKASKDTSTKAHLNVSVDLIDTINKHLDKIG